jgi:hypothetical protein
MEPKHVFEKVARFLNLIKEEGSVLDFTEYTSGSFSCISNDEYEEKILWRVSSQSKSVTLNYYSRSFGSSDEILEIVFEDDKFFHFGINLYKFMKYLGRGTSTRRIEEN